MKPSKQTMELNQKYLKTKSDLSDLKSKYDSLIHKNNEYEFNMQLIEKERQCVSDELSKSQIKCHESIASLKDSESKHKTEMKHLQCQVTELIAKKDDSIRNLSSQLEHAKNRILGLENVLYNSWISIQLKML